MASQSPQRPDQGHTVIRHGALIRAPVEKVWTAMTTKEGLDSWFTHDTEIDARRGGRITFRWKDWGLSKYTGAHGGDVLEIVPMKKFVYQWDSHLERAPTKVHVEFRKASGGTEIHLEESGFPDTSHGRKALLDNAIGWGEALTLLKFYVEHGVKY